MRNLRFLLFSLLGFFTTAFTYLFAPGQWANRTLVVALCGLLGADAALCDANLFQSTGRSIAAEPAAIEQVAPGNTQLAQRSREFDDDFVDPAPANNQTAPPYPYEPGPNQPLRRPDFDDSEDSNNLSPQSLGFQSTDLKNATVYFLDQGNCVNIYELALSSDNSIYAKSVMRGIPSANGICTDESALITATFENDLNSLILKSSNNSPSVRINNLRSQSWEILFTDESGERKREIISLPNQISNKINIYSYFKKLGDFNLVKNSRKVDCGYMNRQRKQCERGRRIAQGINTIINLPSLGGGAFGFALRKLSESVGFNLPSWPKLKPLPEPIRLPISAAAINVLAAQQIAESLMSFTCSLAFGDRYNNHWINRYKELNPDFSNWLSDAQKYAEKRLEEAGCSSENQAPVITRFYCEGQENSNVCELGYGQLTNFIVEYTDENGDANTWQVSGYTFTRGGTVMKIEPPGGNGVLKTDVKCVGNPGSAPSRIPHIAVVKDMTGLQARAELVVHCK